MQENGETGYEILEINNSENINISNGKIVGDKNNHDYSIDSTHEWGMGIKILGSTNINIENLEILEMTGDGIYISTGNDNSESISIKNCVIKENRRQGISIISGEKINISDNEIYNIEGTNPQSGIDLEANNKNQKIDQIDIFHNKIYNSASKSAFILHNQIYNVKIRDNILNGNIYIYETKEKTEILNNKLIDGKINAGSTNENSTKIVNNLDILNNELNNYEIEYNDKVNNINIDGNQKTE